MKYLEKASLSSVGLMQATGVVLYCGLIALFFYTMTRTTVTPPGFFGFFLMLTLLVFSAAVSGSIVFGYSAYLALVKNKIKEALTILAFTLLYILAIILVSAILILSFA